MKILVISDIHSNALCLEAVLSAEKDADRIYCLGDFVDVGLYPEETVQRLRDIQAVAVRGNHDDNIIRKYHSLPPADDEPWTFPLMNALHLSSESIAYLESLPERLRFQADGTSYLLQHLYHGYDGIESIEQFLEFWDDPESAADRQLRKVCLFGHTHKPIINQLREDCWVVNPGSVGYNRPKDPSIATRYLTITDGHIELKDLLHPHCLSRPHLGAVFQEKYGHLKGMGIDQRKP